MNIFERIASAATIAIGGHVRPDGDCIGSCMSMYNYINKWYPGKIVDVYLEHVPEVFRYIKNVEQVNTAYDKQMAYDVFISLDCGDELRLGEGKKYFDSAKMTINIDHHISNTNFADINVVYVEASSTCETLYCLFEESKVDEEIAESLYTGIIHDTGVFKHSNTSRRTMETSGKLIELGIPFSKIIDESFYQKTFVQNQLLGRSLLESKLLLDGKCIVTVLTKEILDSYGATSKDVDGIIDQLRVTQGVEVAILMHEIGTQQFKVSMRSNNKVNVSAIAVSFGGGGHIKAAGCTMCGTPQDIVDQIVKCIEAQL